MKMNLQICLNIQTKCLYYIFKKEFEVDKTAGFFPYHITTFEPFILENNN